MFFAPQIGVVSVGNVSFDVGIRIEDTHIRDPITVRVGQIGCRNVKAVCIENARQHHKRFITFLQQRNFLSCVDCGRRRFITAENGRRTERRIAVECYRIGIECKTRILCFQFRMIFKNIRDENADSSVEHKHDDVFSFLRERKDRLDRCCSSRLIFISI